jgi:hypothetical protein
VVFLWTDLSRMRSAWNGADLKIGVPRGVVTVAAPLRSEPQPLRERLDFDKTDNKKGAEPEGLPLLIS